MKTTELNDAIQWPNSVNLRPITRLV